MNRLACVDIGNTSVKVVVFNGDEIESRLTFSTLPEAEAACRGLKASYCTTRRIDGEEHEIIEASHWWELKSGAKLPIGISYRSKETLGPDRVAAAIGAADREKGLSVLIADAGTALTLDVVNAAGVFVGGNICAGLRMRLRALHDYTSRLPLADPSQGRDLFGDDTLTALTCGACWGITYEIIGSLKAARSLYGCRTLYVTGGDSRFLREYLLSLLPEHTTMELIPDLVAYGLKAAYEFNHEK